MTFLRGLSTTTIIKTPNGEMCFGKKMYRLKRLVVTQEACGDTLLYKESLYCFYSANFLF